MYMDMAVSLECKAMNYYERHLGDYARDTAHLTILEHGIYTLLLDRYYATERPIPDDQACRIARARDETEKKGVVSVLQEFFVLEEGCWVNKRAEAEIAAARDRINAARENGRKGGRPKSKPSPLQEETQQEPKPSEIETQTEPSEKLSSLQSPVKSKSTRKPKSAGHLIPGDFQLDETARARTLKRYPDCDIEEAVRQFVAHHTAKGSLMQSWVHAWTTWEGNFDKWGYPKTRAASTGIHAGVVMR